MIVGLRCVAVSSFFAASCVHLMPFACAADGSLNTVNIVLLIYLPKKIHVPKIPISFYFVYIKRWCGILCLCVLNLLSVFWRIVSMWLMFWYAGGGVLIFVHYFFYTSWNAKIYCPSFQIPLQINITENLSFPILHHRLILCIKCVKKVLHVLLLFIFHSKIIHHKGELNWSCLMLTQPWCARWGAEATRCQYFLQEFVCQTNCL